MTAPPPLENPDDFIIDPNCPVHGHLCSHLHIKEETGPLSDVADNSQPTTPSVAGRREDGARILRVSLRRLPGHYLRRYNNIGEQRTEANGEEAPSDDITSGERIPGIMPGIQERRTSGISEVDSDILPGISVCHSADQTEVSRDAPASAEGVCPEQGHSSPGTDTENRDEAAGSAFRGRETTKCSQCGERVARIHYLNHLITHEKLYGCQTCSKRFASANSLKYHQLIHNLRHRCSGCKKSFHSNARLKYHVTANSKETESICCQCGQKFKMRCEMMRHMVTHRVFVCTVCKKSFSNKLELDNHTITHSNKKTYKCETCQKCFRSLYVLRQHKRIHCGDNPFKCDSCGNRYVQRSDLLKHKFSQSCNQPLQSARYNANMAGSVDITSTQEVPDSNIGNQYISVTSGEDIPDCTTGNQHTDVTSDVDIPDDNTGNQHTDVTSGEDVPDDDIGNLRIDVTSDEEFSDTNTGNQNTGVISGEENANSNIGNQHADVTSSEKIPDGNSGHQCRTVPSNWNLRKNGFMRRLKYNTRNQHTDCTSDVDIPEGNTGNQHTDVTSGVDIPEGNTGNQHTDVTSNVDIPNGNIENQHTDVTSGTDIPDNTGNRRTYVTSGEDVPDDDIGNLRIDVTSDEEFSDTNTGNQNTGVISGEENANSNTGNQHADVTSCEKIPDGNSGGQPRTFPRNRNLRKGGFMRRLKYKTKPPSETCTSVDYSQTAESNDSSCPNNDKETQDIQTTKCTQCGKRVTCKYLKLHLKSHENSYECKMCFKKFGTLDSLRYHSMTHEMSHRCKGCEKTFPSPAALKHHVTLNSNKSEYKCSLCTKQFRLRCELLRHIVSHSKFVCTVCKKSFSTKKYLKGHVKTHSDERPYQCETCNKRFKSLFVLRQHKQLHSNHKAFHCDICGKGFTQKSNMVKHKFSHKTNHTLKKSRKNKTGSVDPADKETPVLNETGNQSKSASGKVGIHKKVVRAPINQSDKLSSGPPISDPVVDVSPTETNDTDNTKHGCETVINREQRRCNGDTRKHATSQVKTRVNSFECLICSKEFDSSDRLRFHMVTHQRYQPCGGCKTAFSYSFRLNYSPTTLDKPPYSCSLCAKEFKWPCTLMKHMLIHPMFVCSVCKMIFLEKKMLKLHTETHSYDKPYICDICKQSFNSLFVLREHKRLHNDNIQYEGDIYGNSYLPKSQLLQRGLPNQSNRTSRSGTDDNNMTNSGVVNTNDVTSSVANPADVISDEAISETGSQPTSRESKTSSKKTRVSIAASKSKVKRTAPTVRQASFEKSRAKRNRDSVSNRKSNNIELKNDKKKRCWQCGRQVSRKHYKKHLETHKSLHECKTCSKKFGSADSLIYHALTHEMPHRCKGCQTAFSSSSRLDFHLSLNSGKPSYDCSVCGKQFQLRCELLRHLVIHPLFVCNICKKHFGNKKSLRNHAVTHSDERPHECETCRKRFKSLFVLLQHKRLHDNDKQFKCDVCGNCYTQKSGLIKHKVSHKND